MLVSEDHLKTFDIIDGQKEVSPRSLLEKNRYDVVIKYIIAYYFELGYSDLSLPRKIRDIYIDHIKVVTEGKFSELSSNKKNSLDYLSDFYKLYLNIKEFGFNSEFGAIPLASDGSIVNGAHRVSIALALKVDIIPVVSFNIDPLNYSEDHFINSGMELSQISFINIKFSEVYVGAYIACLWPSVDHDLDTVMSIFGKRTLSRKKIEFTEVGKRNLLLQLYPNETWIGSPEDSFSGLNNKIHPCFKNKNQVFFVLFIEECLDNVLEIKDEVRSLYNNGKHSIHITDTSEEVNIISKLIFSPESQYVNNTAQPWTFPNYFNEIKKISNLSYKDSIVLVGSNVFGILGIRLPSDIDYLKLNDSNYDFSELGDLFSEHISELRYYPNNVISEFELENNVFYFLGIRFASISYMIKMKRIRSENKDLKDIAILESMHDGGTSTFEFLSNKFLKSKARIRWIALDLLRFLNIDKQVYNLYLKLKAFFK